MEAALWPTLANAVRMLVERGIASALIGGLAVARGQPRMTVDGDLVILADLLVMKAIAGRPQDDQDIRGLIAAQREAIDWPACLSLAEQLGTAIDVDIAGRLRAARGN